MGNIAIWASVVWLFFVHFSLVGNRQWWKIERKRRRKWEVGSDLRMILWVINWVLSLNLKYFKN